MNGEEIGFGTLDIPAKEIKWSQPSFEGDAWISLVVFGTTKSKHYTSCNELAIEALEKMADNGYSCTTRLRLDYSGKERIYEIEVISGNSVSGIRRYSVARSKSSMALCICEAIYNMFMNRVTILPPNDVPAYNRMTWDSYAPYRSPWPYSTLRNIPVNFSTSSSERSAENETSED